MSAYGVDRCDPLEQLQMDRIHGEYGRKDKSPGALFRDWAGVRALPLPKPFASAAFLSPTAMDDESLHDCFDRGPEEEMTVVSPYAFPERQLSHADLNRSNDLHWLSTG